METVQLVSPLTALSPVVALGAGALLALVLRRQAGMTGVAARAAAVLSVVAALVLAHRLRGAYAPMVMFPFGSISIPLVDLRLDALALTWVRYVLIAALGLILVIPPGSVAAALALLAAATASLLGGSLGALVIAWVATEAAFLLFDTPRSSTQMSALPLSLGGVCMVLAIYASASQDVMVLSDASLQTVSWVLLLLAASLRLRLWPLSWPDAEPQVMALWVLVSCSTSAALVQRLASAPVAAVVPSWVPAFAVLSAAVSAVRGWTRRDGTARQDAAVALAALLLPLAATALPPSAHLPPALAHLSAVVVVLALAPALRHRDDVPRVFAAAVPVTAVVTLLPWPFLPFGQAYAEALTRLAAQRSLGGVLGALVAALALALLALRALESEGRPALTRRMQRPGVIALAAALLTLLLGLSTGTGYEAGGPGSAAVSAGATVLAWLSVIAAVGLVWGRLEGLLSFAPPSPFATAWPRRAVLAVLRSLDTVLRLIEGETALTWTTVIGVAILAIALQT